MLHPLITALMQTVVDPSKIGPVIGIAYIIAAAFTSEVRNSVPEDGGFRNLTHPIGIWMLFPVAMILFPILGCISTSFAIYSLTRLLARLPLNQKEWAQLLVFIAFVPLCIHCTIGFFRSCVVRRRYNETGFEWGVLRFTHRIEWTDVVSYRTSEFRGLQLRLRNGSKVKLTTYLNGVPELAQKLDGWIAVNPA